MSDELHGLDDYLTRADDDIPSGDGRKVKPLMLTCQTCGWRGPVSDAARPCIDAGHKLIGRNGQVQQFSESWRTKTLSTSHESRSTDGDVQAMIGVSVTTPSRGLAPRLKPNSPRPADAARPAAGSSDSRSRNHSALMAAGQTEDGPEPSGSLTFCASCDDDCTGAVYQYVAGSAVCCDACARAVLASLEE